MAGIRLPDDVTHSVIGFSLLRLDLPVGTKTSGVVSHEIRIASVHPAVRSDETDLGAVHEVR